MLAILQRNSYEARFFNVLAEEMEPCLVAIYLI